MAAHSGNEPRRVPESESVLDARSKMHPQLLFAIKLAVAVIGTGIAVSVLFVPGLYSFPVLAIDIVVTVTILAILVFFVDNSNTASYDNDMVRLIERKGAEVQLSDFYQRMSFDELETLGRQPNDTTSLRTEPPHES